MKQVIAALVVASASLWGARAYSELSSGDTFWAAYDAVIILLDMCFAAFLTL